MSWYFTFFVVSGFCALVYEVVWLRLAMASFGVTTALVSIMLSMFMAGLGLGSWGAGILMRREDRRRLALRLYSLAELLVGVSAVVLPYELKLGRVLLQTTGSSAVWQSSSYYVLTGIWIAITIVPWCACMGSTFPLLMAAIRQTHTGCERAFSFLYLANVLGALLGTLVSAFVLIELLGFQRTLYVAGVLNAAIAFSACKLGSAPVLPEMFVAAKESGSAPMARSLYGLPDKVLLCMLFTTGLVSMGMEVVWIRQFTPYLGNVVYAFAGILAVYLLATVVGSHDYRAWSHSHKPGESASTWTLLAFSAVIPIAAADPLAPIRVGAIEMGGVRLSAIVLFCALTGFLTPLLLDACSSGDPARAGVAYAVNVLGSIIGPLVAGFGLLPWVGERWSIVALSVPLFALAALTVFRLQSVETVREGTRAGPKLKLALAGFAAALIVAISHDYENKYPERQVRRDYTATVIAAGKGFDRQLLVNGIGMTVLTPITKYMAHLPMAYMRARPQRGLVICFGMGTTFRSMLSWGIPAAAVDLVPSVPALFGYFHSDALQIMASPLARIVVDDGRRFLDGSSETFDVIVVDPPPPPQAPGSSLLYSKEFYDVVKRHLRPEGVLQMWYPADEGDGATKAAVTLALQQSFPHLRAFESFDRHGIHYLASMSPLAAVSGSALAARLPASAAADLVEWGPESDPERQFNEVLSHELSVEELVSSRPVLRPVRDDQPINEYYFLRSMFSFR